MHSLSFFRLIASSSNSLTPSCISKELPQHFLTIASANQSEFPSNDVKIPFGKTTKSFKLKV
ncbi:hypothetical protein C900_03137 [Fulvivirga imtechensis AK7]|uniref:Uncharacterized protein n=1 Tax=Fulvivirga imtechensis AK7 TaxID=1237149 RepID=L8JUP0_9BACT|nr:hypothetical protein C900_03137 [Fulvivirga imtechensis AK7]